MGTFGKSPSLIYYPYKLPGPRNAGPQLLAPSSISPNRFVADPEHSEGRQISMWSWVDLAVFLARLLLSPLQSGEGWDEQWLHQESLLLQKQLDYHVYGKSLSRPGPEGPHSVRTSLALGRSKSSSSIFLSDPTRSKVPPGPSYSAAWNSFFLQSARNLWMWEAPSDR